MINYLSLQTKTFILFLWFELPVVSINQILYIPSYYACFNQLNLQLFQSWIIAPFESCFIYIKNFFVKSFLFYSLVSTSVNRILILYFERTYQVNMLVSTNWISVSWTELTKLLPLFLPIKSWFYNLIIPILHLFLPTESCFIIWINKSSNLCFYQMNFAFIFFTCIMLVSFNLILFLLGEHIKLLLLFFFSYQMSILPTVSCFYNLNLPRNYHCFYQTNLVFTHHILFL